jgi:hypothetical protein
MIRLTEYYRQCEKGVPKSLPEGLRRRPEGFGHGLSKAHGG